MSAIKNLRLFNPMNASKTWIILVLIFKSAINGFTQNTFEKHDERVINTGYSYQNQHTVELGFGRASFGINGHHSFFSALTAGSEILLGNDIIIGPKISIRVSGGMSTGLNIITYTDFQDTEFVFRPDIGIGLFGFAVVYGYNIRMNKTDLNMNRHVFSLVLYYGKGIFDF